MVYIKVLCGIGNFSGDPFIRFQPAVLDVAHIVASFELLPFTFIRLSKSPSRFLLCHYATIVAAGHFHLQFLGVCKEHKKASNAILGAQVTTVMLASATNLMIFWRF